MACFYQFSRYVLIASISVIEKFHFVDGTTQEFVNMNFLGQVRLGQVRVAGFEVLQGNSNIMAVFCTSILQP